MMTWIWGAITAIALIVEFVTADLVSIWFVGGGLICLLVSAIFPNIPIVWQVAIFVLTSVLLLIFTRPLIKKFTKGGGEKTNTDALVGLTFKVKRQEGQSAVYHKIGDVDWRVVSEDESELLQDTKVEVVAIKGNKLIVKQVKGE